MSDQYQEFRSAGAEVLAVVHGSKRYAERFGKALNLPFPCLVDTEHAVFDLYQIESRLISLGQRPGLYVIDRQGVVRFAQIGWQQWDIPRNAEVLKVCGSLARD